MGMEPNQVSILSIAFWKTALEHALVAGASVLAASQVWTSGAITVKSIEAVGVAAFVAAVYALVKQIGGVQLAQSVRKVSVEQNPGTQVPLA